MRRGELAVADPGLLEELARLCGEGLLALVRADGFPRALAVNFVLHRGAICFHGARAGEKFERITADGKVGFTLIQALSLLPSTWFSPTYACPATQLYRSVEITGRCVSLDDPAEKAAALQALMDRYQPEGGFQPLAADDPLYRKALAEVGVFRVAVTGWTGKVKLLQDKPAGLRRNIADRLAARGAAVDLLTVALMERYGGDGDAGATAR